MISSAPSDSGYVKTFIKKSSGKLLILLVLTGILFFCSCESKIEKIQKSEILNLPSVTARNASTLFTDSGKYNSKCLSL